MIQLSPTDVGLITAGAGKLFIEIADSMPAPPPTAGYFTRWLYGFMQKLASNGVKAEAVRNGSAVTLLPEPPKPLTEPHPSTPVQTGT